MRGSQGEPERKPERPSSSFENRRISSLYSPHPIDSPGRFCAALTAGCPRGRRGGRRGALDRIHPRGADASARGGRFGRGRHPGFGRGRHPANRGRRDGRRHLHDQEPACERPLPGSVRGLIPGGNLLRHVRAGSRQRQLVSTRAPKPRRMGGSQPEQPDRSGRDDRRGNDVGDQRVRQARTAGTSRSCPSGVRRPT